MNHFDLQAALRGEDQIFGGWVPDPYAREEVINDPNNKHPVFNAGPGALLLKEEPQSAYLWEHLLFYWPDYQRGAQGIGDCVSWGAEIAETILCCKAWRKRRRRRNNKWIAPVATEPNYGGARVEGAGRKSPDTGGDGANGSYMARFAKDYGCLLRHDLRSLVNKENYDLRVYSAEKAKHMGRYGCGGEPFDVNDAMDKKAREHPVKTISQCNSFEDVAAAIGVAGCTVTLASMYGTDMKRDKYGQCKWNGSWAHQMAFGAVRHGQYPGAWCMQSWGPNSASGPSGDEYCPGIPKGGTPQNILGFGWWVPADDVNRICREGEVFAFGDVDGWKKEQYTYDDWFTS